MLSTPRIILIVLGGAAILCPGRGRRESAGSCQSTGIQEEPFAPTHPLSTLLYDGK